jgi:hypothetical protein
MNNTLIFSLFFVIFKTHRSRFNSIKVDGSIGSFLTKVLTVCNDDANGIKCFGFKLDEKIVE